jgi:hypothetical protein
MEMGGVENQLTVKPKAQRPQSFAYSAAHTRAH